SQRSGTVIPRQPGFSLGQQALSVGRRGVVTTPGRQAAGERCSAGGVLRGGGGWRSVMPGISILAALKKCQYGWLEDRHASNVNRQTSNVKRQTSGRGAES